MRRTSYVLTGKLRIVSRRAQWSHSASSPRIHEYLKEMHAKVLSKNNALAVGEAPCTHKPEDLAAYVLPHNAELTLAFHFELVNLDAGAGKLAPKPTTLPDIKHVVAKWQARHLRAAGFWNALYLENHDQARSVSRFGDDRAPWRARSAQVLAMLQATQAGTLFVYQGEELGMRNFPRAWGVGAYKDIETREFFEQRLAQRKAESGDAEPDMADVLDGLQRKARDHARTPMQWDAGRHAGFTTGTPWMRVNEDCAQGWNVEDEARDPQSVLSFWKRVVQLRKDEEVFVYGDFELLLLDDEHVFAYTRTLDGTSALVVMNFSDKEVSVEIGADMMKKRMLLSNYGDAEGEHVGSRVSLRGWEGRIYL